jgi:hypothetical protein
LSDFKKGLLVGLGVATALLIASAAGGIIKKV